MNKREAKKKAHAIAAAILDDQVGGIGALDHYGPFTEDDTQRLEDALQEIIDQHQRRSGYATLD